MIKLENINMKVKDFEILKDINLHVNKKDKLGIIGLSGAGKSSLLRMINGLNKPTSGDIYYNDFLINNLNNNDLNNIRKDIGMIFQHFNLLNQKNVYENIKLSLDINNVEENEKEKRVKELLKLVNLEDKIYNYPKTLSGGEKQRVAIARALASNPKVLLCDEATSALDESTSKEILDLLNKINMKYDVTIIFVSHDLEAVKYLCNKALIMDKGQIVEKDTTLNLFTNPKLEYTKRFLNNKIYSLVNKSINQVYQLTYLNNLIDESLISNLIKKYNVELTLVK